MNSFHWIHFIRQPLNQFLALGLIFFSCWPYQDSCVFIPCSKKLELKKKKQPFSSCDCCWFDKSSTLAKGEDTKVFATAWGPLLGFAQRNLKHLNLFDHNLILKEAMIYSMLAWHLSSDKPSLTHTHPREDWVVESLHDCILFSLILEQAFIFLLTVKYTNPHTQTHRREREDSWIFLPDSRHIHWKLSYRNQY